MADLTKELLGYGPLGLFAIVVCWIGWQAMKKFAIWGERYVTSAEELHNTLRESDRVQRDICERHTQTMQTLTELMRISVTGDAARDVKIDTLLVEQKQQATLGSTGVAMLSIERLRLAAMEACQLCRLMHTSDAADTAALVAKHCDEITRVLDHEK